MLTWLKDKIGLAKQTGRSPEELIAWFEHEIELHEIRLYGLALYFECISVLYAGREGLLETHRKEFRNMLQQGQNASERASALLMQVKLNPKEAALLEQFDYGLCAGHPERPELVKRCEVLVGTYDRVFPDRPKSQPFAPEETIQLVEEAARDFAAQFPEEEPQGLRLASDHGVNLGG